MLLASRFAEINWDHIAKCTLSETSEYCSGLCDSHPQALWRYPGALQIQRNPLQALEYSQAVKTQGSKPGGFTRLLISLSVLLAFFRVWRLRPDQEELSPARSILYQHLVVSLNSTERKGGSKAAPSNEVHQESVLYMKKFTSDWWLYLHNSYWVKQTNKQRKNIFSEDYWTKKHLYSETAWRPQPCQALLC